jgi:predicted signal transduction protein with EAL and GGDEF domain
VERIASRLVEAMRAPFELAGRELFVRGSVGIAIAESPDETADELLRNADVAMYNAKEGGKGRYAMYEPEMHLRVARRHELSAALDRALDRGEISIRFQPIVRLADERAIAVEALLRWRHPRYGFVSPVDFVPIAEETGLMIPFTRFVLTAALESSKAWAGLVPEPERAGFCVAVNLSPTDLLNPYLVREVAAALEHTGWDPDRLVLEITETGAMRDPATTLRALHSLRGLGVRLALDDFGTGHSSLDHLGDFPVDVLKIAKPFVDRIGRDRAGITFVESILRLVSVLGLRSVAEGIEGGEQHAALREIGCELGQGYHFARPLELDGLLQYFAGGSVPAPPEADETDDAGTLGPLAVPRAGRRGGGSGSAPGV